MRVAKINRVNFVTLVSFYGLTCGESVYL